MALKYCPGCGNEDGRLVREKGAGEQGVDRFFCMCLTCGLRTDWYDLYLHGKDEDQTKEKAVKAWQRRPREARSEELAELCGKMRCLMITISKGCKAQSVAARAGRDACKVMQDSIEKILPLARKGGEIVQLEIDREKK